MEGIVLVVVILFLFLGNVRSALDRDRHVDRDAAGHLYRHGSGGADGQSHVARRAGHRGRDDGGRLRRRRRERLSPSI